MTPHQKFHVRSMISSCDMQALIVFLMLESKPYRNSRSDLITFGSSVLSSEDIEQSARWATRYAFRLFGGRA